MTPTLSTKCWEGDYRDVLRADTLAELFAPLAADAPRQVVLNRIDDREAATALVRRLQIDGHLQAWAWAEDMWPGVARSLGIPITWFGKAWPYSAPELCELALAETDVVAHLAGDVRLEPGEPWLPRAAEALRLPGVAAVSPRSPTGSELSEAASQQLAPGWGGTRHFSDQCFVVRRDEVLRSDVVRAVHPAAGRYPRPGGALTFEARVGAWLHSADRWRAMDVERAYRHPVSGSEGDSYTLSSTVPELVVDPPDPQGYPSSASVDATAVVIAKDDERTVAAAVRSVAWCRDVVVVDRGSSDRTVELALAAGATTVETDDGRVASQEAGWVVRIEGRELVPAALAVRLASEMRDPAEIWCARRSWILGEEQTDAWPELALVARHSAGGPVRHLPADREAALVRLGPPSLASWWEEVGRATTERAQGAVLDRRAPLRMATRELFHGLARRPRGRRAVHPAFLRALETWLWAAKGVEATGGGETAARARYDEIAAAVLSGRPLAGPPDPS